MSNVNYRGATLHPVYDRHLSDLYEVIGVPPQAPQQW